MTEPQRPPECIEAEETLRWLIAERDYKCVELEKAAQAALAELGRIEALIGMERAKFPEGTERC